ncbi:MAG: tRNA (adenosine(37)-N6)-threonylcarbamoyltransferase complex dimerization subunit type 1 TsaB [Deltaproteobacteria bacterium RBG_13_49_15]|nr:MAG: tRNA (adenosine(37)-N6)-threonylcarbamoyltransferase complex dimerization subunit type 1 TsaB [Deltaproteobacteria bacterium RBG_13_49_15]
MNLLAIDTAAKSCSVAIVGNHILLCEISTTSEETHSKRLMEMIHKSFSLSGLSVSDIDGFAVTRGPGSFTGLRIGISTLKGLAMASGMPVVGVSTLDALASQSPPFNGLVCPMLDARKNEVYIARYRFARNGLKKEIDEQVLSPERALTGIEEPCYMIGEGAVRYREAIRDILGPLAIFAPPGQHAIRASSVAFLSMEAFCSGRTETPEALVPRYIRKADAEKSRT